MTFHNSLIQAAYGDTIYRAKALQDAGNRIRSGLQARLMDRKLDELAKLDDPLKGLEEVLNLSFGGGGIKPLADDDADVFMADLLTAEGAVLSGEAQALVRAHASTFRGDERMTITLELAEKSAAAVEEPKLWAEFVAATNHARAVWVETVSSLRRDTFGSLPNRIQSARERLKKSLSALGPVYVKINARALEIGRKADAIQAAKSDERARAFARSVEANIAKLGPEAISAAVTPAVATPESDARLDADGVKWGSTDSADPVPAPANDVAVQA